MSVRAGNIPLDLPLGSIGDVCLEWHGQFDQVDGGSAPNNNVWALVSGDNVLGEVLLTWNFHSPLHSPSLPHTTSSFHVFCSSSLFISICVW